MSMSQDKEICPDMIVVILSKEKNVIEANKKCWHCAF